MNYTYCGENIHNFNRVYSTEIHGYLTLLICIIGSITNVVNIRILTQRTLRNATNIILSSLAFTDLLVMLEYIPYTLHMYLTPKNRSDFYSFYWSSFVLFHAIFTQVFHTISIFLTLNLAFWRYWIVVVNNPARNADRKHSTATTSQLKSRVSVSIWLMFVLGLFVCIPTYFSFSLRAVDMAFDQSNRKLSVTERDKMSVNEYVIRKSYVVQFSELALQNHQFLKKFNFLVYSVIIKLLPCITLTYFSYQLIDSLIENRRRHTKLTKVDPDGVSIERPKCRGSDRTTLMLLIILVLFIMTELPQGILGLMSMVLGEIFFKECYLTFGDIMDLLALLNSSINFILYCSMSLQFRSSFQQIFFKKCS